MAIRNINIALEIGEEYLKIALAKAAGPKESRLSDFIVEPVKSLTGDKISRYIADAVGRSKLKSQPVIVSIPRNCATVRNLHLPSKNRKEIGQMIGLHLPRIVPYKKEEAVFDHKPLGIDEMGYSKEILSVVHIDIPKRTLNIIEDAGLSVERIDLSSYGVWRWVVDSQRPEMNDTDIYLLLDVDTMFTDFIIFSRHSLLFTRSIAIGSRELDEKERALALKRFVKELKQSLMLFYNEELNKKPRKVFISGARTAAAIAAPIGEELDIPAVTVPSAYSQGDLKAKGDTLPGDVSLSAVGELASDTSDDRGVSFVLPEIVAKKARKENIKKTIILAALIVYLLVAAAAIFLGRIHKQRSYLDLLTRENLSIEADIGDLPQQAKRIEFVKDFLRSRRVTLVLLYELQGIIPNNVSINSLNMDESNKVTLRGQGELLSDVFGFVTTLKDSGYFKDVATKYTRAKRVRDKEFTDFEVDFRFAEK